MQTIENITLEQFVAILYHPNDKQNKNKWKFHKKMGSHLIFFGKPRNRYEEINPILGWKENPLFVSQEPKYTIVDAIGKNKNIGGPRIVIDTEKNTWKYCFAIRGDIYDNEIYYFESSDQIMTINHVKKLKSILNI
jgi:hypothetical protein